MRKLIKFLQQNITRKLIKFQHNRLHNALSVELMRIIVTKTQMTQQCLPATKLIIINSSHDIFYGNYVFEDSAKL